MKRMLAGSLLFLLGTVLVGGARNLSTDEAEASAAETVTLTWQSFVSTLPDGEACIGVQGSHSDGKAYDLFARANGSSCTGQRARVYLRTVGFGLTMHRTAKVTTSFFEATDGCNIGRAAVQEYLSNIHRGTYRFLHTTIHGTSARDLYVNPSGWRTEVWVATRTVDERAEGAMVCSIFSGEHVHQDVRQDTAGTWNCLSAFEEIPNIWDWFNYHIHQYRYTEGSGGLAGPPRSSC